MEFNLGYISNQLKLKHWVRVQTRTRIRIKHFQTHILTLMLH